MCPMHYERVKRNGDPGGAENSRKDPSIGYVRPDGYRQTYVNGVRGLTHQHVVAEALGRSLNLPEEIHHVDGNRLNNAPSNLVVCPDRSYHRLLHIRARALEACGNADARKCVYCKEHDSVDNMQIRTKKSNGSYMHGRCNRERQRKAKNAKIA